MAMSHRTWRIASSITVHDGPSLTVLVHGWILLFTRIVCFNPQDRLVSYFQLQIRSSAFSLWIVRFRPESSGLAQTSSALKKDRLLFLGSSALGFSAWIVCFRPGSSTLIIFRIVCFRPFSLLDRLLWPMTVHFSTFGSSTLTQDRPL